MQNSGNGAPEYGVEFVAHSATFRQESSPSSQIDIRWAPGYVWPESLEGTWLEIDAMGPSKCELSYAMPGANWDASPRRSKSEISARALKGSPVTHLRPPPGAKPAYLAELPFDNFEPRPEQLKSSRHHLGGKIMNLLKLRKKSSSAAPTTPVPMENIHQPSLRVSHFQGLISHSAQFPGPDVDDVTKRYNDDSDEHSGNYASDTQNSSSASMISSSSRNSNSSELESSRSSGTPRGPGLCSGQLSNSQLMANILISIMDDEDSASGSASEELGNSEDHTSSEDHVQIMASLHGPHESAWHQPRDEMVIVVSPTVRGRQSSSSTKHLRSGRTTSKAGTRSAVAVDGRLTSPGPSRRFGKLDLSRIEVHKFRC